MYLLFVMCRQQLRYPSVYSLYIYETIFCNALFSLACCSGLVVRAAKLLLPVIPAQLFRRFEVELQPAFPLGL